MPSEISIRLICPSDLAAFKAMRLAALRDHPEAFGMAYEDDVNSPDSSWAERIRKAIDDPSGPIFVAETGNELAGMIGIWRNNGTKVRHAANIWGVYVYPQYRGRNLGERLVQQAIQWCESNQLRFVRLNVTSSNTPAFRCYQRCGFSIYGISPQEIRVGDTYHDELMMWRKI